MLDGLLTSLPDHVEVSSVEWTVQAQEFTHADVDPGGAREEEQAERAHAAGYARFSDGQKRVILALVSHAGPTQSAYSFTSQDGY